MKNSNEKNTGILSGKSYRIIVGLLCLSIIGGLIIHGFQSSVERNSINESPGSATPNISVSQGIPVTDSASQDGSADGAAGGRGKAESTGKAAIMPAEGEIIKAYSGEQLVYSKTLGQYLVHKGVDIKAPVDTPVIVMEDGTVTSVQEDDRYGITVKVSHGDGLETVYGCLGKADVSEGDVVTGGDVIGTVGESSLFELEDGPHLHFETIKDGTLADPAEIWNW